MKRSYKIGMLGLVAGLALTVLGAPHWWTSAEADGANASNGYYCGSYNGKTGTGMMNGNGYGMMGGNFSGTNMAEIHNQMMNGNYGPNGTNMAQIHNQMMSGYTDKNGNTVRPMMQQNADGSYTCNGPQYVQNSNK